MLPSPRHLRARRRPFRIVDTNTNVGRLEDFEVIVRRRRLLCSSGALEPHDLFLAGAVAGVGRGAAEGGRTTKRPRDAVFGSVGLEGRKSDVILRRGLRGATDKGGEQRTESGDACQDDLCSMSVIFFMTKFDGEDTHSNIQFDDTPQDKHGRVSGVGDGDDLNHPHDRTNRGQ